MASISLTNHIYIALSTDNLTFGTYLFDRGFDFHRRMTILARSGLAVNTDTDGRAD